MSLAVALSDNSMKIRALTRQAWLVGRAADKNLNHRLLLSQLFGITSISELTARAKRKLFIPLFKNRSEFTGTKSLWVRVSANESGKFPMNVFTNLSRPLRTNSKLRIQLLIFRCRVLKAEMIDSELTFKVPLNNNNDNLSRRATSDNQKPWIVPGSELDQWQRELTLSNNGWEQTRINDNWLQPLASNTAERNEFP